MLAMNESRLRYRDVRAQMRRDGLVAAAVAAGAAAALAAACLRRR